jgi:hypothetical protein
MLWQHGKAYLQDLRDRMFAAADAGMLVGRIAENLLVSGPYVSKVLPQAKAGLHTGGNFPPVTSPESRALVSALDSIDYRDRCTIQADSLPWFHDLCHTAC